MNFFGGNFQRQKQKLVRQFEIAVRIGRRHATFVRPEKMDVVEGNGACFGLHDGRGKKFLRDPPAGKRDAMRFARAVGRFNFVQPRSGGGAGQFVGTGEGKQFSNSPFEIILSPAARARRGRVAPANHRRQSAPRCRRRKIHGSSAPCLPSRRGWNPRSATRSPLRRGG